MLGTKIVLAKCIQSLICMGAILHLTVMQTAYALAQEVPDIRGEMVAAFDQVLDQADLGNLEIDRVAARLGDDPGKIVSYVQDNIGFEPYKGSLRGAQGALVSGRGNPLDQALLLAGLLNAVGFETRLLETDIPPEAHPEMLAEFAASGSEPVEIWNPADLAASLQTTVSEVTTASPERVEQLEFLDQTADRWLDAISPVFESEIGEHREWIRFPNHLYFVEYNDNGAWSTATPLRFLDTSQNLNGLLDLQGQAFTLTEEDQHHVSIEMVATVASAEGDISEVVLLDTSLAAADVFLEPIEIAVMPATSANLDVFGYLGEMSGADVMAAYVTSDFSEFSVIRFFDFSGNVFDDPEAALASQDDATSSGLDAATGALSGLFGSPEAEEPTESRLNDILVRYEVQSPSGEIRLVTRSIAQGIDLATLDEPFMWQADMSVVTGEIPAQFTAFKKLESTRDLLNVLATIQQNALAMGDISNNATEQDILALFDGIEQVTTASEAQQLVGIFQAAFDMPGQRTVWTSPGVVVVENYLSSTEDALVGRKIVDIAHVGNLSLRCSLTDCNLPTPDDRLRDGLLWSAIERNYIAELENPRGMGDRFLANASVASAGSELDRAPDGTSPSVLRVTSTAQLSGLQISPQNKGEIEKSLSLGQDIILIGDATDSWFQFDPSTGLVLNGGSTGRAQSFSERVVILVGDILGSISSLKGMGQAIHILIQLADVSLCLVSFGHAAKEEALTASAILALCVASASATFGGMLYNTPEMHLFALLVGVASAVVGGISMASPGSSAADGGAFGTGMYGIMSGLAGLAVKL